jgi:hypothetical protein
MKADASKAPLPLRSNCEPARTRGFDMNVEEIQAANAPYNEHGMCLTIWKE